jgi:dihydrofolate reductase
MKLIVSEFVTLDGVMEAPGGEEGHPHTGWVFDFMSPEQEQFKLEEVHESEALLLGRVTYEGFAAAWPARGGEFADKMNNMPKYVASTTLKDLDWNNSHLIHGDVADEVAKLKQKEGRPLLVAGSRTLVHTPHAARARRRVPAHDLPGGPRKRQAPVPRDARQDNAGARRHPHLRLGRLGAHVSRERCSPSVMALPPGRSARLLVDVPDEALAAELALLAAPWAGMVKTVEVSCWSAGIWRTKAMRRPSGDQASPAMTESSGPRDSSRRPPPSGRIDRTSAPANTTTFPGFTGHFLGKRRDAVATGTVVVDGETLVDGSTTNAEIETLEDNNISHH